MKYRVQRESVRWRSVRRNGNTCIKCMLLKSTSVSLLFIDARCSPDHERISWPLSSVFGPDMFGSAFGREENGYQITDGWFANISTIYDPDRDLFQSWIDTNRNPYGFVTAAYNFQVRILKYPYFNRISHKAIVRAAGQDRVDDLCCTR